VGTDPEVPLDIVLHTPGGLVLASLQIARAIHKHKGKVTAVVPHYAMSGGTLIALAADEIVMSECAVVGPVDPQVGQYAAASVLKAVSRKPIERVNDETLILADQAEKAIPQVRDAVRELLADMHLYPQPVRRQPGVEYLPVRRRTENPLRPPER
jgi:ClpP class serine protease